MRLRSISCARKNPSKPSRVPSPVRVTTTGAAGSTAGSSSATKSSVAASKATYTASTGSNSAMARVPGGGGSVGAK